MSKSQPWDYFPMLELYAFTSKKKLRKFVRKRTGLEPKLIGNNGQCTWYQTGGGGFVTILLDIPKAETMVRKVASLAHECVHYAQYHAEAVGTPLDDETQAYIVQSAMSACIDQIGKEWFV